MAINRISGNILQDDLQRGANLSIQGNLVYFDVTNNRVGFLTNAPTDDVTIDGTANVLGNITAEYYFGDGSELDSVFTDRGSDSSNWNLLTSMGVYRVNRTSWAGTTGTPINSTVYVGLLHVMTAGDATTQIFYPGTIVAGDTKIQWTRSYWNSAWTDWIKSLCDDQIIDAGSF